MCMIYRSVKDSEEEKKKYGEEIENLGKYLAQETAKGKVPLIITGSGISSSVPNMAEMMEKIEELVEADGLSSYSETFRNIFREYVDEKHNKGVELHTLQSRLLTYIQNAYLKQERYVQGEDIEKLEKVWTKFIIWLLKGEGTKERPGIINAEASKCHDEIRKMYKEMNAFSITTNFDNLLQKAFGKEKFVPILEKGDFDNYYTSTEEDGSYVEIQSRGDVFWVSCTGKNNRACPNIAKKCYTPGHNITDDITCKLCGSPAKVYFAFPGMKEKDAEMAQVMNGVWKFLAYKISAIIIIGSSMDYDPVLIKFIHEMIQRRNIKILYISRYKEAEKGIAGIDKKAATRFLFRNPGMNDNIWCRAEQTEEVLSDLLESYMKYHKERRHMTAEDAEDERKIYEDDIGDCIGQTDEKRFETIRNKIANYKYGLDFVKEETLRKMSHYSQLGLKTYWLEGEDSHYNLHNRYRHSVGVMLIASCLYLKIKGEKATREELQFLQLAALFHDVGHLPFSHLLEEIFQEFGWTTPGEVKTFNHEEHTRRVLRKLIKENNRIKEVLDKGGYTEEDLYQLIGGEYGIGYMDALMNSPLDCDKIEYLFSDSIYLKKKTIEDFKNFLNDFSQELSINSNDFLVLSGESTREFLNLLEMRGQMYETVYLRKGLRYLEACCKLIMKTFIACKCTEEKLFNEAGVGEEKFFDLSWAKINYIIDWMKEKLDTPNGQKGICEIYILKEMVKEINGYSSVSGYMKETIRKCMEQVERTTDRKEVKKIEKERVVTFDITDKQYSREQVKKLVKDVYLKFPGILMVDFVQSKAAFSFGKIGFAEQREDGTGSAVESILIKDIRQTAESRSLKHKCMGDSLREITEELHFPNHTYVNLYRITDDAFRYMQAEDFVLSQLRKQGVISYE